MIPLDYEQANGKARIRIAMTGVLQGIGLRPTVFRLANSLGLAGWVTNSTAGVIIEIEGPPEVCRRFESDLPGAIPAPGKIERYHSSNLPVQAENGFRIEASVNSASDITPIPPDVATCEECVTELFTPENRRYLHPFITCTLCGPRFTVVRGFPYDRERTSMADFHMCPECFAEYSRPEDRRFHSQTNSCPVCGPTLTLTDTAGAPLDHDSIPAAIAMLAEGKILAVKGIGGFHLACDALNDDAVQLLRWRKGRGEKPFAVMIGDLQTARRYCSIGAVEAELLVSAAAPIVLTELGEKPLSKYIGPGVGTLGVMLPYTPLHHLLFKHPSAPAADLPQALVMTSGNRSEEPIAHDNQDAFERLQDLVDGFLIHNRDIALAADDSVFRVMGGEPVVLRRSRGIAPSALRLKTGAGSASSALGAGGDLKNAQVIVKGDYAAFGPHVGDLASPASQAYFEQCLTVLTEYLNIEPDIHAVDPHPEYYSSRLAGRVSPKVHYVYHHHAHAVSLMAEHGLTEPMLCAVFDGTGYGDDAAIWGGEFLLTHAAGFERVGRLAYFPLPGGEAAIKNPLRILAGLLEQDGRLPERYSPIFGGEFPKAKLWLEALAKGINSPITSSMGRLFDAAAAAVGFRRPVNFEGQAAMWLEGIADKSEAQGYSMETSGACPLVLNPRPLIRKLVEDILLGTPQGIVAARFHNSIADATVRALTSLSHQLNIHELGLSGGCFQNKLLTEGVLKRFCESGLKARFHKLVPPNDGGIALGQAVAAQAMENGSAGT